MKNQNKRNRFIYLTYLVLLTLIFSTIFMGTKCERGPIEDELVVEATYDCGDKGNVLQLNCPAPPNTNLGNKNPDYDIFAWNTFIALNWPALASKIDDDHVLRGIPDLNQSFREAKSDDLLVWETLAEKREVFNVDQDNPPSSLPSWNSNPHYGILRHGQDSSLYPNEIAGSTTPPGGYIFNTLDETVQVKAEGLEKVYQQTNSPAYRQVVAPRIWRGQPADGNPVRYQVKVNYDFYRYVNQNQFYVQNTVRSAAANTSAPGVKLPYRTTALNGPQGTQNPNRKVNYQVSAALDSFITINKSFDANSTPPEMGAVHIKSAWIRLFEGQDTFSNYHTTVAEYYESTDNGIEKRYATFGLVGLHIIQRVHTNTMPDTANQIGGTFIFATWEHIRNESDGFTYLNYLQRFQGLSGAPGGWFPHKSTPTYDDDGSTIYINPDTVAFPVRRKFDILAGTKAINQQVWDSLPAGSVWRNYQLIGTQFKAVDVLPEADSTQANYNDPDNLGQPQFLANIVIETNEGLQHFQGQPPLTYTVSNFKNNGVMDNDGPNFVRTAKNMTAGAKAINMGGCMGCHGVAQSEGYSFSFVLLGAYDGAGTDTQKQFDFVPPTLPEPPSN